MVSEAWVSGYSCIDPSCVGDSWVFQKSKPNTKKLFDELFPPSQLDNSVICKLPHALSWAMELK